MWLFEELRRGSATGLVASRFSVLHVARKLQCRAQRPRNRGDCWCLRFRQICFRARARATYNGSTTTCLERRLHKQKQSLCERKRYEWLLKRNNRVIFRSQLGEHARRRVPKEVSVLPPCGVAFCTISRVRSLFLQLQRRKRKSMAISYGTPRNAPDTPYSRYEGQQTAAKHAYSGCHLFYALDLLWSRSMRLLPLTAALSRPCTAL